MVFPWFRTFSITKEVGRKYVKLSIPFPTLDVRKLKVQDWNINPEGNSLDIRLRKEQQEPPELQEKLENYQRYSVYPGEANKTKD
jgi:hypothetical protein